MTDLDLESFLRPRCPVHGIPDCSALLNGCSLPNMLSKHADPLVVEIKRLHRLVGEQTIKARDALAERDALQQRFAKAARHPYKGPGDTDASMLLAAANRLRGGYEPGGSWTKQTVANVLDAVAVVLVAPAVSSRPGMTVTEADTDAQTAQQQDRSDR